MSGIPQPSIDRGPFRLNAGGRWEIRSDLTGDLLHEVTSGDVIFVEVGDTWKLTRIEFDHASRTYVSIDGYPIAAGVIAALPTA